MWTLLVIAAFGLCLSLIIHLCTLFAGFGPPEGLIHFVNSGYLITFFSRQVILKVTKRKLPIKGLFKTLFGNQPHWKKLIAVILIAYGIVAFMFFNRGLFIALCSGEPDAFNDHEFFVGLSALWIAIYTEEISTLYCYICLKNASVKRCPYGHDISHGETYCEKCGLDINQENFQNFTG